MFRFGYLLAVVLLILAGCAQSLSDSEPADTTSWIADPAYENVDPGIPGYNDREYRVPRPTRSRYPNGIIGGAVLELKPVQNEETGKMFLIMRIETSYSIYMFAVRGDRAQRIVKRMKPGDVVFMRSNSTTGDFRFISVNGIPFESVE